MSAPGAPRPVEVLLVEDNPGDVRLTREALRDGKAPSRLSVVQDGVEALRFLRREGPYADAPRPDVVLLDLNLPRKDGRQVVEEMRADPALRALPVVILTSSEAERDVALGEYADRYFTKPADLDQYIAVMREIEEFWLTVVPWARDGQQ